MLMLDRKVLRGTKEHKVLRVLQEIKRHKELKVHKEV